MNVTCKDLDRILEQHLHAEMAALETHAAACEACREQLALDREISATAMQMQRTWESPELWPRIRERLAAEPRPAAAGWNLGSLLSGLGLNWQVAAATAVLALMAVSSYWLMFKTDTGSTPAPHMVSKGTEPQPAPPNPTPVVVDRDPQQRLLTEEALKEVERAEATYVQSIDRLSALAAQKLAQGNTPLLMNYREKLLVLDSAIAECRAQLEQNSFNAHLRRELLAIYQMKQATLTEVLQEAQ